MCKRYQLLAIVSYVHIAHAASIHVTSSSSFSPSSLSSSSAVASASSSSSVSTSTSANPSTLLLPPGFDSQLPPRQPMLYPFVVSSSAQPTPSTRKPLGPFISPGWIPISSSNAIAGPLFSSSSTSTSTTTTTTTPQPYAGPILEDRISKYALETNDNGPVFESIIYGTWKPDPPLQPVEIVNATTTTITATTKYNSVSISDVNGSSISRSDTGYAVDGKVSNKTINRQHGGFIDNKQHKPIKFEKDSQEKPALLGHKSTESIDSFEHKPRIPTKFVKKQGRQKIRPNSTTTSTTTTTMTTTSMAASATHQLPLESTEQSATTLGDVIIKANVNVPVEVVRQINDSIEIKYNHKQTSRHSIEMTAHERYDEHRHHHHHHHNHKHHHHDDDDAAADDDEDEEHQTKTLAPQSTELQPQEDEYDDDDDELGNSSVIRMNWPTDFMDIPLTLSTSTEQPSDENDSSSSSSNTQYSTEADSDELPLALSSLNIPPSLWPKLPGNITKLGSPYAAENSLEEPAICVPITVREFNMMNSNEVVNIERVFCFPMPSGTTTARVASTTRSSVNRGRGRSSISPPVVKASIQNYEEYFESHATNASSLLQSHLYLLCYVLVFYFKFIF